MTLHRPDSGHATYALEKRGNLRYIRVLFWHAYALTTEIFTHGKAMGIEDIPWPVATRGNRRNGGRQRINDAVKPRSSETYMNYTYMHIPIFTAAKY